MVRGWRNDPRWVEFYKRRDEERAQREIMRLNLELQMRQNAEALDRAIERMTRKPLSVVY